MRFNPEHRTRLKYGSRLVFISLSAALAALYLFSAVSFSINSFEFKLELVPFNRGETVIVLPPLGEVRALTHRPPFMVRLTLVNFKPSSLPDTLSDLAEEGYARQLKEQLRQELIKAILRWVAISGLGGAGGWFLLNRKTSLGAVLAGGVFASTIGLILFGLTVVHPYDLDSFKNPRYQGVIGAAPWVVELVTDSLSSLKTAGEQLKVLSVQARHLCDQLEQTYPTMQNIPLKVLVVSDLHNNPAALSFMDEVIRTFQVDLIIDIGDLTDYGTALESNLINKIAEMPVPYLFIPGNHDNPQVVAAMKKAGVLVASEEGILEAGGLRVLGLVDPASLTPFMKVAPDSDLRAAGKLGFEKLYDPHNPPDLVAAHNLLMAEHLIGRVPVILSGHTHRPSIKFDEGTLLLNPGSVGAAGIRGVESPGDIKYSLAILYFEKSTGEEEGHSDGDEAEGTGKDEDQKLTAAAVDLITIPQLQDSFTVQRFYKP